MAAAAEGVREPHEFLDMVWTEMERLPEDAAVPPARPRARGRAQACGQLERLGSVAAAHVWIGPLLEPVPYLELSPIGWVIPGGESGPAHRPLDLARVRDIRDRCAVNRAGPTAARVGHLVTGRAPPSVTDTGSDTLSTQSSPTRQGFRPTQVSRSAKDPADARARLRIRFGRLTADV